MKFKQIISVGAALFAMLFGAGNVVFPLGLARGMGDAVWPAVIGLFLTGVITPMIGVFSGVLFEGDYRAFFARIGTIPGQLLIFVCMLTIGPLGAAPRTLTLSHAGFAWYFPSLPLWVFTIIVGFIILALSLHEGKVLDILGKFLAPLKIGLLSIIIIAGLLVKSELAVSDLTPMQSFLAGVFEGYNTLDLLGALFFSKLIFVGLDKSLFKDRKSLLIGLFASSCIGALLLGTVYSCFMMLSAYHAEEVAAVPDEQLIFAFGDLLLRRFGIVASFSVAIACITTAIVLATVFADYLSNDLFRGKISYRAAIVMTVFCICAVANLGFGGLMAYFIVPIAIASYPTLIMLSLLNIGYKLFGFKPVKTPVFLTFALTLLFQFVL